MHINLRTVTGACLKHKAWWDSEQGMGMSALQHCITACLFSSAAVTQKSITWTEYFHVSMLPPCFYIPTTHIICHSNWLKDCSISNIKHCCHVQSHFHHFYLKCKYASICNNFINHLSLSFKSDWVDVGVPYVYMSSWMSQEGGY